MPSADREFHLDDQDTWGHVGHGRRAGIRGDGYRRRFRARGSQAQSAGTRARQPNPPVPGQVKKDPALGFTPNPLDGVPPGHWDDPAYFGIPTTWLPPNYWGPPLRVVFNPNWTAWGVWVNDGLFVPLPR